MYDDAPHDPFAGDPHDPAGAFRGDEPSEPLNPRERQDVLADLSDLEVFRTLLEPLGMKGMAIDCADCGETHYIGWDLLHGNLRHLLDSGHPRVHEPACGPDPDDYVSWEYARGYVDGVIDSEEGRG